MSIQVFGARPSPQLQTKNITPSTNTQYVTPNTGYDGLSQVVVNGDSNLISSNIKSGISIFGVNGNYESYKVQFTPIYDYFYNATCLPSSVEESYFCTMILTFETKESLPFGEYFYGFTADCNWDSTNLSITYNFYIYFKYTSEGVTVDKGYNYNYGCGYVYSAYPIYCSSFNMGYPNITINNKQFKYTFKSAISTSQQISYTFSPNTQTDRISFAPEIVLYKPLL